MVSYHINANLGPHRQLYGRLTQASDWLYSDDLQVIQERVEITSAVNFCVGFRSVGEQSEAGDSRLTVNSFFLFFLGLSESGVKKVRQKTAE